MKKKYFIIPIVAIVLAVLTGLFISLFTTPVLAYITENKSPRTEISDESGYTLYYDFSDWFYTAKKVGKIAQLAYKLNPSAENLEAVGSVYASEDYIKGTHKGNTPPNDFLKNCVKYSKLSYESEYIEGENSYAVPVSSDTDNTEFIFFKLPRGIEYMKALFLDGQTEQSQKIYEQLYSELDKTNMHDCRMFTMLGKNYLYLVFSSSENATVKQWVLDREAELENLLSDEEWAQKFIENYGFLFSNPDYETYVSGFWPDNEQVEDDADSLETQENTGEETAS